MLFVSYEKPIFVLLLEPQWWCILQQGLIHEAPRTASIYFVNPDVNAVPRMPNLHVIAEKAATGVPMLVNQLIQEQC
jgi:hypothetical protein